MAKPDSPRPTDIALDRERHELRIEWRDGGISVYPLDALREACPCAFCRGGTTGWDPSLILTLSSLSQSARFRWKTCASWGTMLWASRGRMAILAGYIRGSICTASTRLANLVNGAS